MLITMMIMTPCIVQTHIVICFCSELNSFGGLPKIICSWSSLATTAHVHIVNLCPLWSQKLPYQSADRK